jgi:hypothetical protein
MMATTTTVNHYTPNNNNNVPQRNNNLWILMINYPNVSSLEEVASRTASCPKSMDCYRLSLKTLLRRPAVRLAKLVVTLVVIMEPFDPQAPPLRQSLR